eukprot:5832828-Alexandrium_andersonii.AAC.1
MCPACAVVRQTRLVRDTWEVCSQEIPGAMPLFPNTAGVHPQKHAVIETIRKGATLLSLPLLG